MTIREKISELRNLMKDRNIDTYVVTKFDPHQSEYSISYFSGVSFISGFTGSQGTFVITKTEAGLFTDGRYYIQATKELNGSGIVLLKEGQPGTPTLAEYCANNTAKGGTIAFDGRTISKKQAKDILEKADNNNINLITDIDLLNDIWQDRPAIPNEPVFHHDIKYTGKTVSQKLEEVRTKMSIKNADAYIISSLDDIAWLFNLRGSDVPYSTIFFAYAIITPNEAILFTDKKDLNLDDGITVKPYEDIYKYELTTNSNVMFCEARICMKLYERIKKHKCTELEFDITTELKAQKSDAEMKNIENAYIKDGVAVVKFIKWLKETVGTSTITEYDVAQKILEFRRQQAEFLGASFNTIAAYNGNGAMMHYRVDKDTAAEILPQGLLLVDSGGHYLDGTTDITRTIVMGNASNDMKKHFTLTLKSVIALSVAKFLHGTTGVKLDTIARMPMWQNNLDYKCGTGHGIGFCLNVHEGPHGIGFRGTNTVIEAGMMYSIEPGVYIENEYGIRTENIAVCEKSVSNDFGDFMCSRTITFCPIDIEGILTDLLTSEEKSWINSYHREVYEKLESYLTDEEKTFLKHETREI